VAVLRQVEDELDQLVIDLPLAAFALLELLELGFGGQLAVPDQVGDGSLVTLL
jgi:hypothetical protein